MIKFPKACNTFSILAHTFNKSHSICTYQWCQLFVCG